MAGYFQVRENFRILDELLFCDNKDDRNKEMAPALSWVSTPVWDRDHFFTDITPVPRTNLCGGYVLCFLAREEIGICGC